MNEVPQSERLELKPEVHFRQIFGEKLQNIEPFARSHRREIVSGLKDVGIQKINRLAPAVIFKIKTGEETQSGYEIWVKDDKGCDYRFPHTDVERELEDFLKTKKLEFGWIGGGMPAYIIQDKLGGIHLVVNKGEGAMIQEFALGQGEYEKQWRQEFLDLITKYGIKQIIGKLAANEEERQSIWTGPWASKTVKVLDFDLVGQIREDTYLFSFAEKYKMTNNQFMRFRIRAITSKVAALDDKEGAEKGISYLVNLDALAKEVISQDLEEK